MAGTEKVGIEIELMNADTAFNTLRQIDETVRSLGRKRTMIKLDDGNIVSIDERIKQVQDRLAALQAAKKLKLLDEGEEQEMRRLNAELKILQRGLKDGTANARTFKQEFNRISSMVAHAGSAMQSFGNAMTQLTSPFGRIADGVLMGTGYKLLGQFTEGLESGFDRYDTMKKYPKLMAEFETSAYSADQSIKDLDKSVQGLPISLDDAVSLAQRYTLSLGDMKRGTRLAIATNNAFLASMATESQRYQGMMQMQDLLNGKKLTSKEWMSLGASMGKAINEIGKELGYVDLGKFRQDLYAGKISTEEFLDALEKVGTEGGSLVKLAEESKDTWEAFFSRVGTAASRMVYGVLTGLDEISQTVTGMDVNQLLDSKIIPAIDNATESIKKWIKAHPEEIIQFFNDLKSIDWKGFAKGFANGLGTVAKVFDGFLKIASQFGLGKLGFFMAFGRFLGKASTILGGFLKGTRHIWAGGGVLAKFLVGKVKGKGIFGKLAGIFGKKGEITAAGEAAKEIPSVATTFKSAFSALEGLIKAAGAITIVAGTGFVAFKAAKSILQDLKDMTDLINGGGWDNVGYAASGVIVGIGAFIEIFNYIGTALGPKGLLATAIAGAATAIVSGSFAADMWAIKKGVVQIRDTIKELDNIATQITNFKGLNGISDDVKTRFQNSIDAINEIKEMFVGKSGSKKDRGQVEAGLPTFGIGKVKSLSNIAAAIGYIQDSINALNKLATIGINQSITSKMQQISRVLSSVARFFTGGTDEMGRATAAFPKITDEKVSSTKNLGDAVLNLKTIVDNLNLLSTMGLNQSINSKLQQIKTAITQVEKTFPTMMGNITGPSSLSKNTNALAEGIRGLRRVVWHLNALAGLTVNNGGVASIVGQIKTALDDIRTISDDLEIDVTVKLSDGFQRSVNETIKTINKAKQKIKTSTNKKLSYTIPVHVTFTVSTNFASALQGILSRKQALKDAGSGSSGGGGGKVDPTFIGPMKPKYGLTGGLIYRANGGNVSWKRRGTDTVPAMLTPGEYVHNRRAVSTFGIDFMRKVNNLDVKGAMDELLHRAGHMANINRGTSIVNNNYNNQKVTINNNGSNGAGFTFKSASRFVGAI